MPYHYQGAPTAQKKMFVCICHEANHVVCIKATSQVTLYDNDPARKAGVVYYNSGMIPFFPVNTAIQPDNPHPIPYKQIERSLADGTFEMLGHMPTDFAQLLVAAINASITMKPDRKQNFLQRL